MDSDDERDIQEFNVASVQLPMSEAERQDSLFDGPELKPFQREQKATRYRAIYDRMCELGFTRQLSNRDHNDDDFTGPIRLRRFFQTVRGFHSGSLDLTGRHEPRYRSIFGRWIKFLQDLYQIRQYTISSGAARKANGVVSSAEINMKSSEILFNFQSKWHTGRRFFSLAGLLKDTDELLNFLTKHPSPLLQRRCLHDLPPELIHHIMELSDPVNARRLGYTSRFFRSISLRYIYDEYWLILDPRVGDFVTSDGDVDAPPELLTEYVLKAQTTFLTRAGFICDNPYVWKNLRTLHISGCWRLPQLQVEVMQNDTIRQLYYQPIFEGICAVLSRTAELRALNMANFKIPLEVANTITSLPNLRTLDLSGCQPLFGDVLTPSQSATNLVIFMQDNLDSWRILFGMKNIRVLHVHTCMDSQTSSLPFALSDAANPFKTVERLIYVNLSHVDVFRLCSWIREANPGQHSRLTHVKLTYPGDRRFDAVELAEILNALRGAPMEYFILDGVGFAEASLLEWIAAAFPNLYSLTLFYIRNVRDFCDIYWPSTDREYARAMSGFTRLKYFKWNQCFEYWPDAYISAIPFLFSDDRGTDESDEDDDESDVYMGAASQNTVKLFATYCRTLEYVAFMQRNWARAEYHISRSAADFITLTAEDADQRSYDRRISWHNPEHGDDSWNL
ncbi:unnamed protein product [Somion occarium]|uniref:F-box domain-containing protein n=1 Tax=Somion occarium TaxID=3059160 RepID=A0ABP1EC07_9APHY